MFCLSWRNRKESPSSWEALRHLSGVLRPCLSPGYRSAGTSRGCPQRAGTCHRQGQREDTRPHAALVLAWGFSLCILEVATCSALSTHRREEPAWGCPWAGGFGVQLAGCLITYITRTRTRTLSSFLYLSPPGAALETMEETYQPHHRHLSTQDS